MNSKERIVVKNIVPYIYDTPLDVEEPKWATNAEATVWQPGSFTSSKLPAGAYTVVTTMFSQNLERVRFVTDTLLELPDDPTSMVLEHIKDFWSKEQAFKDLNLTFKRGIILYGPPGSGKSVTIYRLAALLEQHDVVMLNVNSPYKLEAGLGMIKTLEPNRKIVVVLEDIDGIINRYGDEDLTKLLDGGADVNNVLFLATTNYPSRIPDRVLLRPSRFDQVIKIAMPSLEARAFYIRSIIKNVLVDINAYARATEGLSIAQIKEVIILTQIFDYTLEDAVSKLQNIEIG